jgi:KDO2-lipid IV(A) lauroyltransferase
LSDSIIKLVSSFLQSLPLVWALRIGRTVGLVWHYILPIRRPVARRNVARVFGAELSLRAQHRIVRRCFENICLLAVEAFRVPALTRAQSERLVERRNWHILDKVLQRGKGAIVVTGHMGNYYLAACAQAVRGVPINVIVKTLHWAPAQRFIYGDRERTGLKLIPTRGSRDVIRAALRRGEIVIFIIDQHMRPYHGIVCDFFGQLASTTPAPARFALETGAPIVPLWTYRKGRSGAHVLCVEPELVVQTPYADRDDNLRHNTERLNRVVESWIRQQPDQWLWLHRRWKVQDDPEGWTIPAHPRSGFTPDVSARMAGLKLAATSREIYMTADEQIARMTKAINEAIKVMGNRFGSTEGDVAKAIQALKESLLKEAPAST